VPPPIILLVDAHDDSRFIYAAALGHFGFRVVSSPCCVQAVELAREQRPGLIVLGVALSAGPAWAMLDALRADSATAAIPVLALSTTGLAEHRARALQLGCAAFLVKPLPPLALLAEARRILGGSPSAAE
jgi:DNA-binding response OmpR family regulator